MLEDLKTSNYAPTTVECYIRSVAEFAKHFHQSPDQLGPVQIRAWQLFLIKENGYRSLLTFKRFADSAFSTGKFLSYPHATLVAVRRCPRKR